MISEIDIKDWEKIDPINAFESMNDLMNSIDTDDGIKAYANIMQFITDVYILRKKYVPQVAALFKEKNDGI